MIEEGVCSNKFEELTCLKGEKVKGIFREDSNGKTHYYIVFESGNAFVWVSTGAFWVALKEDVDSKLLAKADELKMKKQELELLIEAAGGLEDVGEVI